MLNCLFRLAILGWHRMEYINKFMGIEIIKNVGIIDVSHFFAGVAQR